METLSSPWKDVFHGVEKGGSEAAGVALADDFVEEDGGGGGDVQGVRLAEHRDADEVVGLGHPGVGEAELLGADDDGDGLGHVDFGVVAGGVGGGGQGADAAGFQPGQGLRGGGFGDGDGEEGADGGADDVGVVEVGAAVADDEGVGPGGVGGAEHGAEVARFFDVFADDEEGGGGEGEVVEAAVDLGAEGEEAFGAVAVGDFEEGGCGAGVDGGPQGGAAGDDGGFVFALVEVGAVEEAADGDAVVEGALDFAVAFDDEEVAVVAVGALAELDDFFEEGVLEAGDEVGLFHGAFLSAGFNGGGVWRKRGVGASSFSGTWKREKGRHGGRPAKRRRGGKMGMKHVKREGSDEI